MRTITFGLLSLATSSAFVITPHLHLPTSILSIHASKKGREIEITRQDALQGVLNRIEKCYGKGAIVKLGDADSMVIDCISSGALTLDAALGGGYPKGRVIEIFGPESSGKTTLALHAIAECQKLNGTAAFVDAEHALDPVYGTLSSS